MLGDAIFWLISPPPGVGCYFIPLFIIAVIVNYLDQREEEKKRKK
jgi:hypothetical protein